MLFYTPIDVVNNQGDYESGMKSLYYSSIRNFIHFLYIFRFLPALVHKV